MGAQPQGGIPSAGGSVPQQGMPQTGNGYNAAANPAGFDPSMLGGAFRQQAMQPQVNAALSAPTGQGPNITDLVRGVGQMNRSTSPNWSTQPAWTPPGGASVAPAAGKGK